MTTLQLELPEEMARAVGRPPAELEHLAMEALMVRLYDEGHVSSGNAGKVLGMSKVEFLDVLERYGVSSFDPTMDVAAEVAFLERTFGNTPHNTP